MTVFVGVEVWFRMHEWNQPANQRWTVALPTNDDTYEEIPFSETVKQQLRFSEAKNGRWRSEDGACWQAVFLRWSPGRIAAHLAQGHTPETCLPASGRKLLSMSPIKTIEVHGLRLPFREYILEEAGQTIHVFYCLWQDRADKQMFESVDLLAVRSRLSGIWTGRRNLGQRSLELVVRELKDDVAVQDAVRRQLQKIVVIEQ
jgi:hypothetical protein